MLTSHYVVTGLMNNRTRYYLYQHGDSESLYMATGFVNDASRFLSYQKAQMVANRENALGSQAGAKIWRGITWQVAQVQIELKLLEGKVIVNG